MGLHFRRNSGNDPLLVKKCQYPLVYSARYRELGLRDLLRLYPLNWFAAEPDLYLNNPQCAAVSVGNTPEGLFEEIVKALNGTRPKS